MVALFWFKALKVSGFGVDGECVAAVYFPVV